MKNQFITATTNFIKGKIQLIAWNFKARPLPPPHIVKQKHILQQATYQNINTLVETGTFRGDMIFAMKNHFTKLYSIELSSDLYHAAVNRFKNDNHVNLLLGDSGNLIEKIIPSLSTATLFWLDGHYSGEETAKGNKETPIIEELHHILQSKLRHTILIDDARLFGSDPAYPNIEEITALIQSYDHNRNIYVRDDIIFVVPFTPENET